MSRTDATKPLWVRHVEHGPGAVHDHRFGPCDLPERPGPRDEGTRCRWEDPGVLLGGRTCCSGCNDRACRAEWQAMVRAANRRERYAGRRLVRRYLAGLETE
ncbi:MULTISPECIES: hypothetical protein [Nocardiopsis]|uniref:4Fe-4S Wbl-type domain-containing protein n=1 Tax=Nocardiopsis changdeensis TaxID=2831969 RepID=A0ABX8BTB2_9ACTN|nr:MULTISPECIES: hypothetical protein [Nocardiopsis]QUX25490.1 hypothetical protein KGD84_15345 [Nocardiopsis changdeensis]QYX35876.1 hypothetical protein K1J57_24800 [Nocardiopsis sp. MT53]